MRGRVSTFVTFCLILGVTEGWRELRTPPFMNDPLAANVNGTQLSKFFFNENEFSCFFSVSMLFCFCFSVPVLFASSDGLYLRMVDNQARIKFDFGKHPFTIITYHSSI